MSQTTLNILQLLDLSLDEINTCILQAEDRAKNAMENLNRKAESLGLVYTIDESYNISRFIAKEIGVDHLKPSYKPEFGAYTARVTAWFLLWHAVRDTITDYYKWTNAEVNVSKGTLKTSGKLWGVDDSEIIKQFANGNVVYRLTDDILETYDHVKLIDGFFAEKMGRK